LKINANYIFTVAKEAIVKYMYTPVERERERGDAKSRALNTERKKTRKK
jgi:hypothetical protein